MNKRFLEDIGLDSVDRKLIDRLYRLEKDDRVKDIKCLDPFNFQTYLVRSLERLLLTDAKKLFKRFPELIVGDIVNYKYYQHCFQLGLENGKNYSVLVSSMNDWVKFEYDKLRELSFV